MTSSVAAPTLIVGQPQESPTTTPALSETANKVNYFLTALAGGLSVFSILAGVVTAILWSVPFGLLGAGIGLAVSLVIFACRSSETVAVNPQPPAAPAPIVSSEISANGTQQPVPALVTAPKFTGAQNVAIYNETMQYAHTHYHEENKALADATVFKNTESTILDDAPRPYPDMKVYVVNTSTCRTAQNLVKRGLNPLVMDMANAHEAGGGARRGANAQEEILARQSNLMYALLTIENAMKALGEAFCIPECGGLLMPKVRFFRADPQDNYTYLEEPFQVDVFALAAYICIPGYETSKGFRPLDDATYETNTLATIENYLRAAIRNGNDSIVASALGCGAFLNVPTWVAGLFKKALEKDEFKGRFKEVAFGIIEDEASKGRNYKIFKQVLETPQGLE